MFSVLCFSRQQPLHHATVNIREPEVAACVTIGETLMIEAEQMQDRRVQIVDMHAIRLGFKPKLIGAADD